LPVDRSKKKQKHSDANKKIPDKEKTPEATLYNLHDDKALLLRSSKVPPHMSTLPVLIAVAVWE
jgi:hypothetical protein